MKMDVTGELRTVTNGQYCFITLINIRSFDITKNILSTPCIWKGFSVTRPFLFLFSFLSIYLFNVIRFHTPSYFQSHVTHYYFFFFGSVIKFVSFVRLLFPFSKVLSHTNSNGFWAENKKHEIPNE